MPGDDWQRFATLRALYAFMYAHPGKKLLFMGGEFAQWHEWAHQYSLDWHRLEGDTGLRHRQVSDFVTRINGLYREEKALYERDLSAEGFAWIDGSDTAHSVVAILRRCLKRDDTIAVVVNWQPVAREGYQIGVPSAGPWAELLNSDATVYGGSGAGNPTPLKAEKKALDGYDYTLTLTLPPLSVLWLKPTVVPAHRKK